MGTFGIYSRIFQKSGHRGYQEFVEGPSEEEGALLITKVALDDE